MRLRMATFTILYVIRDAPDRTRAPTLTGLVSNFGLHHVASANELRRASGGGNR
jgi:hypothetical protein